MTTKIKRTVRENRTLDARDHSVEEIAMPSRCRPGRILFPALFAFCVAAAARGQATLDSVFVSTSERADVSRLTDGGVIVLGDGAGGAVVTIAGEMKGRADREGVIGVVFVPELPFFTAAYRNRKVVLAAAEVTAPVALGETSLFMAKSRRIEVGFTSYHVYLYNTTGGAATVNVYVNPVRN